MELGNSSRVVDPTIGTVAVPRKGVSAMRARKAKKLDKKAKKLDKKAGKATKKSDKATKKAGKAGKKAEKAMAKVAD
jgi:seryl-tRNA synthetase